MSNNIKITSFGVWLGDNNLFEDWVYGNIQYKKHLKERYKKFIASFDSNTEEENKK